MYSWFRIIGIMTSYGTPTNHELQNTSTLAMSAWSVSAIIYFNVAMDSIGPYNSDLYYWTSPSIGLQLACLHTSMVFLMKHIS